MTHSPLFSALVIDADPVTGFLTGAVLLESRQFDVPVVFSEAGKAFRYLLHECLTLKRKPLPHLLLVDVSSTNSSGLDMVEALKDICPDALDQMVVCGLVSPQYVPSQAQNPPLDFYWPMPLNREDLEQLLCFLENRVNQ
jgi:ActR/RegA family two-component response regulator